MYGSATSHVRLPAVVPQSSSGGHSGGGGSLSGGSSSSSSSSARNSAGHHPTAAGSARKRDSHLALPELDHLRSRSCPNLSEDTASASSHGSPNVSSSFTLLPPPHTYLSSQVSGNSHSSSSSSSSTSFISSSTAGANGNPSTPLIRTSSPMPGRKLSSLGVSVTATSSSSSSSFPANLSTLSNANTAANKGIGAATSATSSTPLGASAAHPDMSPRMRTRMDAVLSDQKLPKKKPVAPLSPILPVRQNSQGQEGDSAPPLRKSSVKCAGSGASAAGAAGGFSSSTHAGPGAACSATTASNNSNSTAAATNATNMSSSSASSLSTSRIRSKHLSTSTADDSLDDASTSGNAARNSCASTNSTIDTPTRRRKSVTFSDDAEMSETLQSGLRLVTKVKVRPSMDFARDSTLHGIFEEASLLPSFASGDGSNCAALGADILGSASLLVSPSAQRVPHKSFSPQPYARGSSNDGGEERDHLPGRRSPLCPTPRSSDKAHPRESHPPGSDPPRRLRSPPLSSSANDPPPVPRTGSFRLLPPLPGVTPRTPSPTLGLPTSSTRLSAIESHIDGRRRSKDDMDMGSDSRRRSPLHMLLASTSLTHIPPIQSSSSTATGRKESDVDYSAAMAVFGDGQGGSGHGQPASNGATTTTAAAAGEGSGVGAAMPNGPNPSATTSTTNSSTTAGKPRRRLSDLMNAVTNRTSISSEDGRQPGSSAAGAAATFSRLSSASISDTWGVGSGGPGGAGSGSGPGRPSLRGEMFAEDEEDA